MNASSPNELRRYLIAIGSPYCPIMRLPALEGVETDIERVVKLFTSEAQGYERVLADQIHLGATASAIKNALSAWFSSPERKASDYVIVYYAGHGGEEGNFGSHYLFTVDSVAHNLSSTAIETGSLVKCFFEGAGDRSANILLILDVCYAGQGGDQLTNALSKSQKVIKGSGFWVIASVDSRTEAADGAFVDALEKVMQDFDWMLSQEEFLTPHDLKDAINKYLQPDLQAEINVLRSRTPAVFIRNPKFKGKLIKQNETDEKRVNHGMIGGLSSEVIQDLITTISEAIVNNNERENAEPNINYIEQVKLILARSSAGNKNIHISPLGITLDTFLTQLINKLHASEQSEQLNKITQEEGWIKIYRFRLHLAISSYLEEDENRRNLAISSANATWEDKSIRKLWSSDKKLNEAREKFCELLYECLGWLLMSINYCHPVPIQDGFKKYLKSWVRSLIKRAFKILENELSERINNEGVDREVNIYLNLLIEQID